MIQTRLIFSVVFVVATMIFGLILYQRGRTSVLTQQAVAAASAEKDRVKGDAKLRSLPEYDLCVRYLRSSRLPIEPCDELRGVESE